MTKDKIKILYIDDYELDRELVRDALEKEHGGFELTEAANKEDFEALWENQVFDVVLSDFDIAGFEGLQVLEAVKAHDPRIPVIIVTGTGSEEIAVKALKQGASDYVIKRPKHIQRLPQTILAAMEKQVLREQRRKAEISLKTSEKRYRSLFENMINGCAYCKMIFNGNTPYDFIYIDVNRAFEATTGLKNVVGKTASEVVPGIRETDPALFTIYGRVALSGTPEAFEMYVKSMSMWFSVSVYSPEKEYFIAIFDIITERKQAEAALRESEDKFKYVFDHSLIGKAITFPSGEMQVNRAFYEMLGYSKEEFSTLKWQQVTHPDDVESSQRVVDSLLSREKDSERFIKRYLRKDGASVWADVSTALRRDKDGNPLYFMATMSDITAQRRAAAEKEKLESRLLQAQKMESVGRLAGGVAHDYNNILSVILGYTELALDKVGPNDPIHGDLREILTAAKRSAEITRQLLAFARKQTIAPRVLDLNRAVEKMLKMLRQLIGEDIDLAWQPETNLWPVKMDASQLDQILANLCVNARDAIADVGRITIETGNKTFDASYCADHAGFVPGEFALLAVSDDGRGMDKKTLDHLFEPFFTTKKMGRGTGLGLATVYGIVKQNNGFINVYSEVEKGTTFRIYLPRHTGEAIAAKSEAPAEIPKGHGETVLVVEDEASILKLTCKILHGLGYTVLTATTPGKAMELAKEHAATLHLLITDVVMPEMNGRELSEQLQTLYPDIKTIFMSGYTANVIAHRGVLEEGVCFISKPFSKKELAVKVKAVLDRANV